MRCPWVQRIKHSRWNFLLQVLAFQHVEVMQSYASLEIGNRTWWFPKCQHIMALCEDFTDGMPTYAHFGPIPMDGATLPRRGRPTANSWPQEPAGTLNVTYPSHGGSLVSRSRLWPHCPSAQKDFKFTLRHCNFVSLLFFASLRQWATQENHSIVPFW